MASKDRKGEPVDIANTISPQQVLERMVGKSIKQSVSSPIWGLDEEDPLVTLFTELDINIPTESDDEEEEEEEQISIEARRKKSSSSTDSEGKKKKRKKKRKKRKSFEISNKAGVFYTKYVNDLIRSTEMAFSSYVLTGGFSKTVNINFGWAIRDLKFMMMGVVSEVLKQFETPLVEISAIRLQTELSREFSGMHESYVRYIKILIEQGTMDTDVTRGLKEDITEIRVKSISSLLTRLARGDNKLNGLTFPDDAGFTFKHNPEIIENVIQFHLGNVMRCLLNETQWLVSSWASILSELEVSEEEKPDEATLRDPSRILFWTVHKASKEIRTRQTKSNTIQINSNGVPEKAEITVFSPELTLHIRKTLKGKKVLKKKSARYIKLVHEKYIECIKKAADFGIFLDNLFMINVNQKSRLMVRTASVITRRK